MPENATDKSTAICELIDATVDRLVEIGLERTGAAALLGVQACVRIGLSEASREDRLEAMTSIRDFAAREVAEMTDQVLH